MEYFGQIQLFRSRLLLSRSGTNYIEMKNKVLILALASFSVVASATDKTPSMEEMWSLIQQQQKTIEALQVLCRRVNMPAIAFGITGFAHACANWLGPAIKENLPMLAAVNLDSTFFWLVVLATLGGVLLSFTKARKYEGSGASGIGTLFVYILVATIGLKMDVTQIKPFLFVIGGIWIGIHAILVLGVGKLIKAPLFFLAVGSQANIGGAASAPIVASAFHPALAPVGVLLVVFGYVVGTSALIKIEMNSSLLSSLRQIQCA